MKPSVFDFLLDFLLVFLFICAPASGAELGHLSPHQRSVLESKSPLVEEYRFGFDLPAGP